MTLKSLCVLLLCAFPLSGCSSIAPCDNKIKSQIQSPDGKLKAVVFSRDCGATTDFNTQVSVIASSGRLPDRGGNIFIADAAKVTIQWLSPNRLKIIYPDKIRIYNQQEKSDGVSIAYEIARK